MADGERINEPDEEVRQAEGVDAGAAHQADRAPTPEEEAAAEENELDPDVAEHEREMAERGAHQRGEGQVP